MFLKKTFSVSTGSLFYAIMYRLATSFGVNSRTPSPTGFVGCAELTNYSDNIAMRITGFDSSVILGKSLLKDSELLIILGLKRVSQYFPS